MWIRGGYNDDAGNDLEGSGGEGALIQGGDAYGSVSNPAVLANGGVGATIKGGDIDSGFTTGAPGDALHLIAGVDVGAGGALPGKALVTTGDVEVNSGNLIAERAVIDGGNPNKTDPQVNTLAASSLVKAWARVTFAGGVPTIDAGFNVLSISGASYASGIFELNLAAAVPQATRAPIVMQTQPASHMAIDFGGSPTDSKLIFTTLDLTLANRNLTVGTHKFTVIVMGLQ